MKNDFDRFANLKYMYGNRHFWCRGYLWIQWDVTKLQYRSTQNQLTEDMTCDQISMKEYIDPSTGESTEKGNVF